MIHMVNSYIFLTFVTESNVTLELSLGGSTILHYFTWLVVLYLHERVRQHEQVDRTEL
jgi:hypothetical protein